MGDPMRLVLAVATVLALAACGSGTAAGPGDARAPGEPSGLLAAGNPAGLIGLWTVAGAAGEEPGAVLRLAPDALSIWRRCGMLSGAWRASSGGLFVGHVHGGSDACVSGPESGPGWLRQAAGYRVDGTDRLLVDRGGRLVARLRPGGRPTVGPDIAASEAEPPVVTDTVREEMARAAAPVPAGLRPAAPGELVGRWVPAAGAADPTARPFAELRADGSWSGSDGCNGQNGRWVGGGAGSLLAVAGAQTLIGCNGVDVGGWLSQAARAGFAGELLVLLDRSGKEIGRLRPA